MLNKLLTDPGKIEALIVKYEAATKANQDSLKNMGMVRSAKKAADEWGTKAEAAKKEVMTAELEAENIRSLADKALADAQYKLIELNKKDEALRELSESLLEKEAVLNKKLKQFSDEKITFDEQVSRFETVITKFDEWAARVNAVLGERPGVS